MGSSLVSRFGPGGVSVTAAEIIEAAAPDPVFTASDVTLPRNAVTGAEYRGGNIMRLVSAEVEHGYGSGGWAGFKQWLSVGRVVRKGEHGTACITVIAGKEGEEGKAKGRGVRGFRVFHYDQTTELVSVTE